MPKLSETTTSLAVDDNDLFYAVIDGNSRAITAGNLIASLTQVKAAPTTALGAAGDIKGMIAFDTNYFYICTANYTGSANVWKRVDITTW
jgi:membrane-bound ClpP family serine protease